MKDFKLSDKLREVFRHAIKEGYEKGDSFLRPSQLVISLIEYSVNKAGEIPKKKQHDLIDAEMETMNNVADKLSSKEDLKNLLESIEYVCTTYEQPSPLVGTSLYTVDSLVLTPSLSEILKVAVEIEKDKFLGIDSIYKSLSTINTEEGEELDEVLDCLDRFEILEYDDGGDLDSNGFLQLLKKIDSLQQPDKGGDDVGKFLGDWVDDLIKSAKEKSDKADEEFEKAGERKAISSKQVDPKSKTPFLDEFAHNLTEDAKKGKFDPVVGRDKEVALMTEILCCRKKNNVILLGDPGCGKTAVVEHLVQRIQEGLIPSQLKNKRVYSLDLNSLVSGTKFRGEYEERLQGIIKEVVGNPDIIIYIDEFHNLIGNGSSSGQGDGANILKPYLARGEFQCIGSTTLDEYRKFVEKDGALKRRFQNVQIQEPGVKATVDILKTLQDQYSKYHQVNYTDEVLACCADWSGRFITDRFFPDKAIDLMDMAGSLAKLNPSKGNKHGKLVSQIEKCEYEIQMLKSYKCKATLNYNMDEAKRFRKDEEKKSAELRLLNKKLEKSTADISNWPLVDVSHVASVISKVSGIPVDKINSSDFDKLREMKGKLESKVIGQDEAVQKITIALQRNFMGLRDENKPIASLLMAGPSGTGKTLVCKEVAKEFFGSEKNLIKFDMAEFGEKHEITKLTGSTASYVGYDDTPLLEQVRRMPYSVVLFDEIEKAHPEIYNIFLSILDEGYVTLGNGVRVDFKNTIIVFTGNIGTKELVLRGDGLGFGKALTVEDKKKDTTEVVMKAIKKEFRPEFINRLSDIVIFNSLGKSELYKIFDIEFGNLQKRVKDIVIKVSDELKELIITKCDIKYGARDLQRGIVKYIENEICMAALNTKSVQKSMSGITVQVGLVKKTEEVKVKFIKPRAKKENVVMENSVIPEEIQELTTA